MINEYETTNPTTADAVPASSAAMSNDEVISTVNGLIQTCKDGEEGFKQAADGVPAGNLKTIFLDLSTQRSRFAGELQNFVRSLGGDPEHTGSFSGAVHRGWMDIKTAVSGNDEQAILNECERGEDSAKRTYREALKEPLPTNISGVVEVQFTSILASHDQIKALRDAADNTAASSAGTGA